MIRSASDLIGRAAEIKRLERWLDPRSTRPPVLVLAGETGVGKTAVASAACQLASERGYLVGAARASAMERATPHSLIVEALDEHAAGIRQLAKDERAVLDRLFRSMSPDDEVDEAACEAALRALLRTLGSHKPLLLALEDVHCADPLSLRIVRGVAEAGCSSHVRVLLTLRPPEPEPWLADAGVERLVLRPLDAGHAAAFLADRVTRTAVPALVAASGGVPLFLDELARDAAVLTPDGRVDPPRAIRAAVEDELYSLTDLARHAVRAASIVGDAFDPRVVTAVAELDVGQAARGLDEARSRLLLRSLDGRRLRFRHPIIRDVVYAATPPGWRVMAHRRAWEALAAREAGPTELAPHAEGCARVGDQRAAAVLIAAAESTADPASAAHWLAAALRISSGESEQRRDVMRALARALAASGRLRAARTVVGELLTAAPIGAPACAPAIVLRAMIDRALGEGGDARRSLAQAAATTRVLADAVEVWLELAAIEPPGRAGAWAREALRLARRSGQDAAAMARLALVELRHRRIEIAGAVLADALRQLDPGDVRTILDIVLVEADLERTSEAIDHARLGVEMADVAVDAFHAVPLRAALALALVRAGRLEEAASVADEAIELARAGESSAHLRWALAAACLAYGHRGDLAAALAAGEAASRVGGSRRCQLAHAAFGIALVDARQLDRGRHHLRLALGPGTECPTAVWVQSRAALSLVEVELDRGRLDAAERCIRDMESGAALPGLWSRAALARALLLLAHGRAGEAVTAAQRAATALERSALALDRAHAQLVLARALDACRRREAALEALERAHAMTDACGATRLGNEIAREMRRLGHAVAGPPPHERPVAAPLARLSHREREVATLVAAGYTNREIAAALLISEKTVEKHVSRLLEKLCVPSRAQVAALVGAHS